MANPTMLLHELLNVLEELAPTRYAESWDNVGLLVGDPQQAVHKLLLTIDYTPEVAGEARDEGCDLILAYHPPIFEGLKRITTSSLIHDATRRGVAIYSPHTALDVADGGTNDLLADAIGLTRRQPLRLIAPKANQYKLVTFVPEKELEKVSQALFDAGAGQIGHYHQCSFRIPGTGTFVGDDTTNPAVGQAGKLEETAEIRLETVMPIARLNEVLAALRASHPYEEPAFDLVQLAAPPEKSGQGRIGTMPAVDRRVVLQRIKQALDLRYLLVSGPQEGTITTAACCAGACGDLLEDALNQKAELYLTGEMRHHDALKAARAGMTVACTLHSNSERAILRRLADTLATRLPSLSVRVSQSDRDPFVIQ